MRLKISEITEATGGKLLCGNEETPITSFFTDSREVKGGGMFVPLVGEKTDAHRYIDEVLANGAAAVFTQVEIPACEQPVMLVDDTRAALQRVAAHYRDGFDLPLVGVTGSAGKTTQKEMIALALSAALKTYKTAGNQNSQVGVPLTVCGLRREHRAAVIEMGISLPGEMARIAAVAKPNFAVITNIGVSHIEFLQSRENILAEKLHIADFIPKDGALFVNGDDDLLAGLKGRKPPYEVVTFGVAADCDWCAADLKQTDKGTFFTALYRGERLQAYVPAVGVHNVRNALASLAVAHRLGVPVADAVRAIGAYKPPAMRQQVKKAGAVTLIDDSYNASPDSMKGAIDILCGMETAGRRVAVLGDMLELGEHSAMEHLEVGRYALEKGVDFLIGIGPEAESICAGYGGAAGENCRHFGGNTAAGAFLQCCLQPGDTVLFKGSRGMRLEELVEAVQSWQNKSTEEKEDR